MNIKDVAASAGIDLAGLSQEILAILKESTAGLWSKDDKAYLESLAATIAEEKVMATVAETPEKRKEHADNLLHLAATVRGELVRRAIIANAQAQDTAVRIIVAIIKAVVVGFVTKKIGV